MAKRRKNGSGTLVSKGRGKPWLAKWVYQGKVYYRSTGEIDKQKAKDKLAEFVKPYQEDSNIEVLHNLIAKAKSAEERRSEEIEAAKNIPLDEVMDKFLNDLSLADVVEQTKANYAHYFSALTSFLKLKHPEVTSMKQVTEEIAREFLEDTKDKVVVDTYNFRLVFYKRVWKTLGKEAGCEKNVWDSFEKRKGCKCTSRREFTVEELAKMFDCIKDDDETTLLFSFGIYTGLRKSDCCKMKWENIDLVKREIVIIPQKVKRHLSSPIHIPMHKALFGLLVMRKNKVEAEKIEDNGFVIPKFSKADKHAWRIVDKVFKDCKIETSKVDENGHRKLIAGFHSLRHTFVSLNINGGMNPMLVQKIVGHSTVNMTEHYFHQNHQAMVDGISKMPDVLKLTNQENVIDVEATAQACVQIDEDVYQKLLKMSADGNINDTLRKLLSDSGASGMKLEIAMKQVA